MFYYSKTVLFEVPEGASSSLFGDLFRYGFEIVLLCTFMDFGTL